MTSDIGSPEPRRPGRKPKDQRRKPKSMRFAPTLESGLEALARREGRTFTAQVEFLVEHALRELGSKIYDLRPAPIEDLYDRLANLENELARLRSATEKALADYNIALTRVWSVLYRRNNEVEAKQATDTAETAAVIEHLHTLAAHLLAALKKVEALSTPSRHRGKTAPRPRLVASNDKDAG
jgi:hypothetical protein